VGNSKSLTLAPAFHVRGLYRVVRNTSHSRGGIDFGYRPFIGPLTIPTGGVEGAELGLFRGQTDQTPSTTPYHLGGLRISPKIPSRQIESRRDRVKVYEFSVATESVVAIRMDVSGRRRDFRNYGQGFRILVCLVPGPRPKLMSPTAK
jgi:hypothetical protein